jgi:Fur family ferric uptake transcriptional regulator
MTYTLDDICKKLQHKNYKITPQRQEILKTLLNNVGKHLSAEEVYNIVKEENLEIGLATVYRTLELLSDIDVLQKLNFDDGKTRYEFNDNEIHHHHHLICLNCSKVSEFEDDLLDTLEANILEKCNFKVVDHKVKFYGYCKDCNKS